MSRIFAWSQKCLPTDSLLVARRKICSHTMELNNTFQICRISVTCKGQHRHHVLLGVTPGKAHHHLGDSCCFVAMSCLTLFRPHGLQSIRLLSLGFPMQEYLSGLPFPSLGIFPTQGSNPCLLYWQAGSLPLSHQGSPTLIALANKNNEKSQPR